MLKEALSLVPHDNDLLAGYLCYLKFELVDQLNIDLPKEEYPFGHPKGFTEEEFDKYIDEIVVDKSSAKGVSTFEDIKQAVVEVINNNSKPFDMMVSLATEMLRLGVITQAQYNKVRGIQNTRKRM